jgi:hypothetical protein
VLELHDFDQLLNSLRPIANLYPKVYGMWLTLSFQLEIFNDANRTIFAPNLPLCGIL